MVVPINDTHLKCLAVVAVSIAGCSGTPTLLVENTSDAPQAIEVSADSDLFAVDTIQPMQSWCWAVPEVARRKVRIDVARVLDTTGIAVVDAHAMDADGYTHESHMDSLSLNRSWRLRVRRERFVGGSTEWERHRSDRRLDAMFNRERVPSQERVQLRLIYLLDLFERPDAPRWEQTVDLRPAARCKATK